LKAKKQKENAKKKAQKLKKKLEHAAELGKRAGQVEETA
jgi:hypothetical protein